jgi:hypothetical protein
MRPEYFAGIVLAATCVLAATLARTELFASLDDVRVLVRDYLPATNINDAWFPTSAREQLETNAARQSARFSSVLPDAYVV